jgi:hypothetical protein
MKMRIQLIIEDESGQTTTAEIAAIERRQSDDLIGISLEEAKAMTGSVQRAMVRKPSPRSDRARLDMPALSSAASTKRLASNSLPNAIRSTGLG